MSISTFTFLAPAPYWGGAALLAWRICSVTIGLSTPTTSQTRCGSIEQHPRASSAEF